MWMVDVVVVVDVFFALCIEIIVSRQIVHFSAIPFFICNLKLHYVIGALLLWWEERNNKTFFFSVENVWKNAISQWELNAFKSHENNARFFPRISHAISCKCKNHFFLTHEEKLKKSIGDMLHFFNAKPMVVFRFVKEFVIILQKLIGIYSRIYGKIA